MKPKLTGHLITAISLLAILNFACTKNPDPAPTPKSDIDLAKGLILYFPFTGSIADSSGNNNPVQPTGGAALTSDEHGNTNSAYDASQGRLIVTNNGSIKFDTAFSVCFNFKIRTNGYQGFLSMVDNVTGHGPTFLLGPHLQSTPAFSFSVQDQTASCSDFAQVSNSNNDTTSFLPVVGTWYNIACIYHKGNVEVFMNGKSISPRNSPGTSALLCLNSKFIIGGWWNSDPLTMDGIIDEVRMYNRVLNGDEINQLYKNFQ